MMLDTVWCIFVFFYFHDSNKISTSSIQFAIVIIILYWGIVLIDFVVNYKIRQEINLLEKRKLELINKLNKSSI